MSFTEGTFARRLQTVEALREVLTSGGRTMAQGALAYIWALEDHLVPILGARTADQVTENAAAMAHGPLTQDELASVQAIVDEHEPNRGS